MTNNQNPKELSGQSKKTWPRIIFIEDDEMLARVYEDKLTMAGFEVDIAKDGSEAIQKLESNDYLVKAILTPNELVEKIREHLKQKVR